MEQADLKGKAAIVTGSSSGIGASVALALARRGADVVVNYSKSAKEAEDVAAAVKALGARVCVVQGNVASDADCRKLAAAAREAFGRIDMLVNNAGTTKFAGHRDLDALSAEDFANIYAVNVIGAFQMIRACAESLRKSDDGAVVNVSSIAGIEGLGSSVAYAASKGALNTMTLSLARALAPEIRVNAVCPGLVATPWFTERFGAEGFERVKDNYKKTAVLQRVADSDEIAKSVVFLATSESRNITGETLLSDGGLRLSIGGLRA
ncbi:MAG: glucose 1-dehydrogenase [Alphaproteobacteria bacterium]|nr:glucose 1-dehydrogenase [Alphaproteobacteria bacterium]